MPIIIEFSSISDDEAWQPLHNLYADELFRNDQQSLPSVT